MIRLEMELQSLGAKAKTMGYYMKCEVSNAH
jgi:hypothetical protein